MMSQEKGVLWPERFSSISRPLFQQFTDGGGELWLCPICLDARGLTEAEKVGNVKVAGATPMWEWAGDDTTVFSY